jgi:SAM-dependent methyltransferase
MARHDQHAPGGLLHGSAVFFEAFSPERSSRFDDELDRLVSAHARQAGSIRGYCNVASCATSFRIHTDNLREDVIAAVSGSFNRQRQLVCALAYQILGRPDGTLPEIAAVINRQRLMIYTAEANSALFNAMRSLIDPALLSFSEYFGPDYRSGEMVGTTPHQDLQATSFAEAAFDLVLTSEVMEHVPDALIAEREIVRILKPGGVYCFTVPFLPYHEQDMILADLDDMGAIRYYADPQYHGDPVRPEEGILVYRLFSYRELKQRFTALGCHFETYRYWSKTLGILGNNALVCVVRKG